MEKISHQNHKNSFIKRVLPVIIIVLLVIFAWQFMSSMKTEPAKIPEKPKGFLVETATLKPSSLTIQVESQGTLQAKRQITLASEVSGKVLSLSPSFTVGGFFNSGDVLITLDPADYRVAVARADANVASAQAQLDLEQAKSDQAKKDWQSFGKKGQPSALLLNIPQLDGAKANLKAAKADLMKAKRDLEKTEIKAPFDGTVISKSVDLGQFIGMSGQLATLAGTAVAEVRLPLTNDNLIKLNLAEQTLNDKPLQVVFTSDQQPKPINGHIKRLESSKDSRTLMTYAVAEVPEPFAQGMLFNSFLQAKITGQTYDQVYAVPTAWMMPNDQLSVYQTDGTLAIKSVHVVHKTNEYFYVDDGLTANDQIITTPIQAPEVGMKLRKNDATVDSNDSASEASP
ncbi:efflux RND transporter periplasmic adaptor subunit [Marinicella litoralis]|uniref:RND family efflux transporter MFP subunit n=2 Tax=Marinicella litoralis TaxID=644220 RepID=A0A4R6XYW6_9GAMM|nr:efflux RND transporter periplasmic adaptor subunit [Marinicella litoralis]TDR23524.1 RND family efflux transporter MFP subunit [Marinicella litoralis]